MSVSKNAPPNALRRFKPADFIILTLLIIAFISISVVLRPASGKAVGVLVITPESTYRLDLNRNQVRSFSSDSGSIVVEINNGTVRVIRSSCRDKFCVKHRPISMPGERIICLPARITVEITGDEEVDAANF